MASLVNDCSPIASCTSKTTFKLFFITILIYICATSAERNGEPSRCHWCGPLAEQVHRSRRAPPCDAVEHITCEPGYQYCAVVATAPPYIESRFCVKLYQDECYPLYCNTTKTWKMTCPCRGDLCNGINTEREEEAFEGLTKLVAKTHNVRIKRFIQGRKVNNTVDNNNPSRNVSEAKNEEMDSKLDTLNKDKVATTEWTPAHAENNIVKGNVEHMKSVDDNKIDGMQDDKITTTGEIMQKDIPIQVTETTVIVTTAPIVTQSPIKNEEKVSITKVKPTEQMPPAESLQEAANTDSKENKEKPTEMTSTETTVTMAATTIVEQTTIITTMNMSKPGQKGFAVKNCSNLIMLLVSVMVFLAM